MKWLSTRPPGPGRGGSLRSQRSVGREHGLDGLALDSQTVSSPTRAWVTRGEARGLQRHQLTFVLGATQATVSRRVEMHSTRQGVSERGPASQVLQLGKGDPGGPTGQTLGSQ